MKTKLLQVNLREQVQKLLHPDVQRTELEQTLKSIQMYFQELNAISGHESKLEYLAAMPVAYGKALGLNHAAQCLLDYKRTVKFLKGMVAAIKDKQEVHPNTQIQIFYVGCGPYAPFITLIAPLFAVHEIYFSVLEVNPHSMAAAKELISALDLGSYVEHYYQADALTFTIPDAKKYHIVINETLDAVLYRESFVPIVFQILPQLENKTIMIPENVQLAFSLVNETNLQARVERQLATIWDTRMEESKQRARQEIPEQILAYKIPLAKEDTTIFTDAIIDTAVQVYGDNWLYRNESSLTLPLKLHLEPEIRNSTLVFHYKMRPEIELVCSFA